MSQIDRVSSTQLRIPVDSLSVVGDSYDRYQLDGEGRRLRGNGTVPPSFLPELVVPLANLAVTLTDNAAAIGFFGGSNNNIFKLDLAGYKQARLTGRVPTASASAASPKILVRYSTTLDTTAANLLPMGLASADVSASIFTGVTMADSGWTDLVAGCQIVDCFVGLMTIGGDATADPVVANIMLHLR